MLFSYQPFQRALFFLILFSCGNVNAQNLDSLVGGLDSQLKAEKVQATFKSPTVVFSQSNETRKAHSLGLVFRHDFGPIAGPFGGAHTLFGLDVVQDVYIGFDYGLSDQLSLGFGRSADNEQYNFNIKYKLLQQNQNRGLPFSLSLFAQPALIARRAFASTEFSQYGDRTSLFFQAILARKCSSSFSLELSPSFLHQAKTNDFDQLDSRNLLSMGLAGRMKLSKRLAILLDYQLVNGLSRPSGNLNSHVYYNPLGLGFEIETGGHVFSLLFQNTNAILENRFLPNTTRSWLHSGVSFAFSISRDFNLYRKQN